MVPFGGGEGRGEGPPSSTGASRPPPRVPSANLTPACMWCFSRSRRVQPSSAQQLGLQSPPRTVPPSDPCVHRESDLPAAGRGRSFGARTQCAAAEALPLGVLQGQTQSLSVPPGVTSCAPWIFKLVSMFKKYYIKILFTLITEFGVPLKLCIPGEHLTLLTLVLALEQAFLAIFAWASARHGPRQSWFLRLSWEDPAAA